MSVDAARVVKRKIMRVVVKAKSWDEYRWKITESLKRIQLPTGNRVLQYLIDPAFGPTVFCLDLWVLTEDTWVLLKKTWTIPDYERCAGRSEFFGCTQLPSASTHLPMAKPNRNGQAAESAA
ncbi:MAG: hypothetical protein H7Z75_08750 [Ferruginibacter sp.]|nr:hypothetical protein [Cytophagales bacterium]